MNTSHQIRSVCVYCGSRVGDKNNYEILAADLGSSLADAELELVYGAGSIGLMGILARTALEGGGSVYGVIPKALDAHEITQNDLTELHITKDMHERKNKMYTRADAFVVLPGGLGSLDEFFETLTWAQLSLHKKPIYLLNHNGYWNPLIALIDHVIDEGFAGEDTHDLYEVVEDVSQLMTAFGK